jgi:prevent-host-death family protein
MEPAMTAIGTRALKNQLSRYLKRVQRGERLVVTARGKTVAILSPPSTTDTERRIEAMLREGVARWGGGKPKGSRRAPRVRGRSVAQAVIEGRR